MIAEEEMINLKEKQEYEDAWIRILDWNGMINSERSIPRYLSYPGIPDMLGVKQLCCSISNRYCL